MGKLAEHVEHVDQRVRLVDEDVGDSQVQVDDERDSLSEEPIEPFYEPVERI